MTRATSIAAAIAIVLSLTACVTAPPTPVENYYRLQPEQLSDPNVSRLPLAVRVQRFTADGLLRERAMLYTDDDGQRILKQHNYHFWMDSPTRMLRDYWVARLERTDRVQPDGNSGAAYILHGRLRRMERLLHQDGVDIALGLELRVVDEATGEDLMQRRYDVVERAATDRVVDSVKAYETALRLIHSRFIADLGANPALAGDYRTDVRR